MNTFTRSLVAVSTAATVGLSDIVATAEDTSSTQPVQETATRDAFGDGYTGNQANAYEIGRLIGHMAKDGYGAMPDTYEAGYMAGGSVSDLGMTGDETYTATQAGWGILWTVLALVGVGSIYNAAKGAGLI